MASIENDIASSLEVNTDDNTTESANAEFTVPDIQCPTIQTRYRIGDLDISLPFYTFQMVVKSNFMELNIEENV
ncbi:hypothetical protein MFLAVUS_005794 [Mucor flavus]|uniref:Uncharacterized protein n=1 Tax=Mucor flavus TaxID=439312 RepID=A0ABP9YZS4_9FUNG